MPTSRVRDRMFMVDDTSSSFKFAVVIWVALFSSNLHATPAPGQLNKFFSRGWWYIQGNLVVHWASRKPVRGLLGLRILNGWTVIVCNDPDTSTAAEIALNASDVTYTEYSWLIPGPLSDSLRTQLEYPELRNTQILEISFTYQGWVFACLSKRLAFAGLPVTFECRKFIADWGWISCTVLSWITDRFLILLRMLKADALASFWLDIN